MPFQLGTARAPDPDPNEAHRELVEEPGLPEPGLSLDHQQCKRSVEREPDAAFEALELARPAEQANGTFARVALRPADWAGKERVDVLLAEDRRLQRPRLDGGVKAELLVQPQAESAVDLERIVPAPERIEGEHRDAVSALAETIERDGSLRMRECSGVVKLGQCRVGGLQACT